MQCDAVQCTAVGHEMRRNSRSAPLKWRSPPSTRRYTVELRQGCRVWPSWNSLVAAGMNEGLRSESLQDNLGHHHHGERERERRIGSVPLGFCVFAPFFDAIVEAQLSVQPLSLNLWRWKRNQNLLYGLSYKSNAQKSRPPFGVTLAWANSRVASRQ